MELLRLLQLPLQVPSLSLLLLVGALLGHHWTLLESSLSPKWGISPDLFWMVSLIQVFAIVLFCTIPSLLLRQLSLLMASSRVVTLVVTLLIVVTIGVYLLHINLLRDVLILASSLMLVRLDLARIGLALPERFVLFLLSTCAYTGLLFGRFLPDIG